MMPDTQRPNVVSFHLDNLGYGSRAASAMESKRSRTVRDSSGLITGQEIALPV